MNDQGALWDLLSFAKGYPSKWWGSRGCSVLGRKNYSVGRRFQRWVMFDLLTLLFFWFMFLSGFGRTHVISISDIAIMIEISLDELEGAVVSSASVQVLPSSGVQYLLRGTISWKVV